MKKSVLTALLVSAGLSAFAFDFGGSFVNNSKLANQPASDGDLKLHQKNAVSLWISTPFGSSADSYFTAAGKYQFERDFGKDVTINALDLSLCKAVYVEDEFTITAGRFAQADLSGLVYCQNGDGCSINFESPVFKCTGYGFYTGFLNSQFVTILDEDYTADSDKLYDRAPAYLVTGAKAVLPYFLGEQSVSAEGIFTAKMDSSKRAHTRVYAEAALEGPLFINGFYYNITGVIGFNKTGSGDFSMGNLSKGSLTWYGDTKGLCVAANSVYASGHQGPFDNFRGFTSQTATAALTEPEWSGIFVNGLSASVKPTANMLLSASADAVIHAASSFKYAGFQYDANIEYQATSDIYAAANIVQYLASEDSDTNNKTAITLKVIVTF